MLFLLAGLLVLPAVLLTKPLNETALSTHQYSCSGMNLTYNNIDYCLYTTGLSYKKAEKMCHGGGTGDSAGHLVAIHHAFLNSFLRTQLQTNNISTVWLGSEAGNIGWGAFIFLYWNDRTNVNYNNLNIPNQFLEANYLTMDSTGNWIPTTEDQEAYPFICEPPLQKS